MTWCGQCWAFHMKQLFSDVGQQAVLGYGPWEKENSKAGPTIALAFCLEAVSRPLAQERRIQSALALSLSLGMEKELRKAETAVNCMAEFYRRRSY